MKLSLRHIDQAGFTMVEIIMAIVLAAIVFGTVNVMLINQIHIAQRNRDLVVVNSYAEGKIEALRSAGYKSVNIGTTNLTSELPVELNTPRSGTLTVTDLDSATKKIDLTITYNDQGANRSYTYTTYIGELGVGQY